MVGDSIIDEPVPCRNYSFPEQYWHTYNNEIYASVSIATTQTALGSSVDEAKAVCKAILGSGSLLFEFRSGTATTLLGASIVEWLRWFPIVKYTSFPIFLSWVKRKPADNNVKGHLFMLLVKKSVHSPTFGSYWLNSEIFISLDFFLFPLINCWDVLLPHNVENEMN